MAIFFDAPVEPDALTTFVRRVPTDSGRFLTSLFSRDEVLDNVVDFAQITSTSRVARFRSYDGAVHVSKRDTGSESRVPLPPLSTSLTMGEYERLQLQFAQTAGTNERALANAIYDDATILTNEVLNRLELAIGDVLTDGKFTMLSSEGGLEADFGVTPAQKPTAATLWTDKANAKALSDLLWWYDAYHLLNGPAGSILTDLSTIRLLCQNQEIIAAVAGTQTGRTRVTLVELNDHLASEGLPTLRPAFDEHLDVDGVATRPIPLGKLLFLPPNLDDLLKVYYGVSATALELVDSNEADLSFEDAPGIVGIVAKEGVPFRKYTYVDAVAMPCMIDSRKITIATVQ